MAVGWTAPLGLICLPRGIYFFRTDLALECAGGTEPVHLIFDSDKRPAVLYGSLLEAGRETKLLAVLPGEALLWISLSFV
jgi:hypothetical protein